VDSTPFTARRASVEDLPALQELWQAAGLPWDQLDGFLNEFQLVTDENGVIAGGIGLLIEGSQALLHTEAVGAEVDADAVRATLWRRVQLIARNQGVQRIWTQEDADYWTASGFVTAAPPPDGRPRPSFLDPTATWLAFDLVDPARAQGMITEQLALLEAARMQESAELEKRIKSFRLAAILVAGAVIAVCLWLLYRVMQSPDMLRRLLGK
jgi:N-acetylglutamate synthase-like GNAT family acetyltransferase